MDEGIYESPCFGSVRIILSSTITAPIRRKQRIEPLKVYSCRYWSLCLSFARLSRRLTVLSS
ncbi:hypothetical protein, partial [Endozoicomonas sp. ONNA1]|uniref:hypothetical protein n=1 Tax=Endozoicomonas sp. ONNA1 TaxID=2828740 RepID=UPI00214945D4